MNNLLNYDFVVKITALIFSTWNINLLTVPTFNIFEYMTSILTSSLVVVILLIQFYCYLVTRWLIRVGLSNEDKMRIHRLYEQGFGAKAIRASYPGKHWSLNTLRTICHRVDETGSAVTHRASSGIGWFATRIHGYASRPIPFAWPT